MPEDGAKHVGEVGRCRADGPVTRKRIDGPVMSRMVCDRPAGHDGPHRTASVEWGGDDE